MEIIVTIILGIIIELAYEGMKSKKIPKWLRILCTIFSVVFFIFILSVIGIVAYFTFNDKQYLLTGFLILINIVLITLAIKKIIKPGKEPKT